MTDEVTTDRTATQSSANEAIYHAEPDGNLSQMMLFFSIAILTAVVSKLISMCVTKIQNDRKKTKEDLEEFRPKLHSEFVLGNNDAAVFITGAEVKHGEENETSTYARGYGITRTGVFDIAMEVMKRAREEKRKKRESESESRKKHHGQDNDDKAENLQTPVKQLNGAHPS